MYVGTKYKRVKGRGLNFVLLVNGGLPSEGGFHYINIYAQLRRVTIISIG